jgi:nucleotide-binding universal stress UspA family protein
MFSYALISLAAGVAMMVGHNVWSGGALPIVVTVVGWLIFAKGLLLLLLTPETLTGSLGRMHYVEHTYLYLAPAFVIGLYLDLGRLYRDPSGRAPEKPRHRSLDSANQFGGLDMYRDLLVHVDESDGGRRRVQFAVDLAARMGARLSGIHVTPPAEVRPRYKPSRIAQAAADTSAKSAFDARAAAAIFHEGAGDATWFEAGGEVVHGIRYADLVILGQYEAQGAPEAHPLPVAHSVVVRCGRPVLVVPAAVRVIVLDRVMVAWDGSREAVRAIHDALPLLHMSGSVQIVRMIASSKECDEPDAKRLAAHLVNHGIDVVPDALLVQTAEEHRALQSELEQGPYDLLVMGGYSHAMWREFIFGGATQSILLSAKTPVFVSH